MDDDDDDKENQAPSLEPEGPQKLLWVEKYTPQRYTDLLSEEVCNVFIIQNKKFKGQVEPRRFIYCAQKNSQYVCVCI